MNLDFLIPNLQMLRGLYFQLVAVLGKSTRQSLPKGTDLSGYTQEQLDAIADEINGRPRKGLGVRSPLSVYAECLAQSQKTPSTQH